jgi:hypothetical protein
VTDHPSTSQLERFCFSALPEGELVAVAMHTADCQTCHNLFTQELKTQKGSEPLTFTLSPEFCFRNDHIDFEQLVNLADKNLDTTISEIIDLHLKVCNDCGENVQSFLAFRKESVRQQNISYGPTRHLVATTMSRPSWRWKPAYAIAAIILAAIAITLGAIAFKRRSPAFEAQNEKPPVDSPNTDNGPTPPHVASSTPIDNSTLIATLKDSSGEILINRGGEVKGLDDLPSTTRQEIAQASLNERLERPGILKNLSGNESGLRGRTNSGPTFKLLYPTRRVIIEDRPSCSWESLSTATSYHVYLIDANGNEIARSDELPPNKTSWKSSVSLKRGEVYSWAVAAVVDGKEVLSPAAAASEVKFAVLSSKDLQSLNQLKRTRSHLALGVFYSRVGLLSEAERELQKLVQLNPQAELPKKLLLSVRSLSKAK